MKVLVVGSGGREHALVWMLSRSPHVKLLRATPGNAGIAADAECLDLAPEAIDAIVAHATAERYDLVVVGPEAPLVAGLADRLTARGIATFGCSARAAAVEGSKVFSKRFMERNGIPTADFRVFEEVDAARRYLADSSTRYPLVVKADGLAAGKGVILAGDRATAERAVCDMLRDGRFGEAGSRVVIEELLRGREVSFFALADGERFVELATCQDYKRVADGDAGPNTGGMGTYSPSVYLDDAMRQTILERIVRPTVRGLANEERAYRGVLYVGLMLTEQGPKVLEYNARFGDPEAQVLLPRLAADGFELLHAAATGDLAACAVRWRPEAAVCVVLATAGYPGSYAQGSPIAGLDEASRLDNVLVFHAGTARDAAGRVVTAGGRVLGVTALGADLARARRQAYAAAGHIRWAGEHHRTDIAADAIRRLEGDAT